MTLSISQPGRVLKHNVSWQEFEQILAERGDDPDSRIAYDRGCLEIIMPLTEHEYFKEIIGDMIKDLADELGLDDESFGSSTWKREDLLAGVEPDNCFYIQSEPLIRDRLPKLDLAQDPPPDLALEIDLTSKSLDRQPIYARLGVPELWRYDQGKLQIYQLQDGQYREVQESLAFPGVPVREIPQLIQENFGLGRRRLRQRFREWVQEKGA